MPSDLPCLLIKCRDPPLSSEIHQPKNVSSYPKLILYRFSHFTCWKLWEFSRPILILSEPISDLISNLFTKSR